MANYKKADQVKLAKIMKDPVAWAQAFLRTFNPQTGKIEPWKARWYQVEMLQDKSKKRVYRCGRRTGKCIPGWAEVIDYKTGERITAEELYKKGKANLVTLNENYTIGPNFTNQIWENGVKEVYRVTTKTGRYIDATGNHPLFTVNGWTEIDDLKNGDKVGLPSHLNYWGNEKISDNETKILAYMIGDGNCTSTTLRFSANNDYPKIIHEMKSICAYYDCQLKQYSYNASCDYNITKVDKNIHNKTIKNKIKEVLIKNKVYGKSAKEKRIPNKIFRSNKRTAGIFLSRLYATDGWVSYKNKGKITAEIGYCTTSELLARDIQHLLLKFGINSYLKKKRVKYNNSYNEAYTITIYDKDGIINFINNINIYGKESKTQELYNLLRKRKSSTKYIPKEILKIVEEDRIEQGLKKKDLCINENDRIRYNYDVPREKLKHYGRVLKNDDLVNMADSEIIFDEIVSIEYIGDYMTYDISIPFTFNFIVNDFITHNTETMVVESLFHVCTKKNFRVLIITPYENQVRLAFMRLNELIKESPIVSSMVLSNTKNPYMIKMNNESAILGFTTGASSGGGAASIRGQRAD